MVNNGNIENSLLTLLLLTSLPEAIETQKSVTKFAQVNQTWQKFHFQE